MCGICGKVRFDDGEVPASLVEDMCRTLVHRGPDDIGIHTGPAVGLGERRLSVIDLSREATPPLANEDRTIWVVCNGEIYNFRELRTELQARGHTFRTAGDTEVILHLYEEHGAGCLKHLRGMFALVLWDGRKKVLFAARDRLGQKPFFYARAGASLVFGSEIKSVARDPDVAVEPNYRAIDLYLTYQYVPGPLTAFEGIFKLPPGHSLTCDANGRLEVKSYWSQPRPTKTTAGRAEIEERLRAELTEAVRLRLVSDVPLGAFLSGGVDSAAVVAAMAAESGEPVRTFTIGFEEDRFDERPFARLIAERFGTEHQEFMVRPNAAEILPLLVRHYNEPFADSSALPTYYLSKMTRQAVTVALSGDGGDESFAGYDHYALAKRWGRLDWAPWIVRKAIFGLVAAGLKALGRGNFTARGRRALSLLAATLPERYLWQISSLKPEEKDACCTDKFRSLAGGAAGSVERPADLEWDAAADELDWMMLHDRSFYLPDCLMVKTDVASMACGLEVRCPMLDHEFVEFAAAIPSRMKRQGSVGKVILRSALKDVLPAETLARPKAGFAVPLARWMRGELAGLLRENLLDGRCEKRGLLRQDFLRQMLDEHSAGRRDFSARLWALLMLELWFREFID